jgi:hypothetical protein
VELFECPYLGQLVELTDERAAHIREEHPALLPGHPVWIAAALADPAEVRRRSWRGDQLVFVRERISTLWSP